MINNIDGMAKVRGYQAGTTYAEGFKKDFSRIYRYMKIAIITSNHLRHKFFAKKIAKIVDVDVCIFESKPLISQSLKNSELKYLGDLKNYEFDSNQILIQKGEINSDKIHNDLIKYHIDYIFTFGCSLLLPRIFEIPSKKCINVHTGLVQYYRGVDSSMWAARDNRFDLIGSAIHEIDSSIDGGKILFKKKLIFLILTK